MKAKPKRDPELDQLVKDIVKIVEGTSKHIDEILKGFPDIPNPLKLKKKKNRVSKSTSGTKRRSKK